MCYLITKVHADVKSSILFFARKRLLIILLCSIFSLRRTIFAEAVAFDELFMIKERTAPLDCIISADEDFIKADCSNQKYAFEVPQTLEKLKVLNLSRNYIKNITKESFIKYKDTLIVLDMSHMAKWTKAKEVVFSADSFLPLYMLEYLDLSESCYSTDFQFPSKIKILIIENCSTTVQISGLNSLEEFYAAGNAWKNCPKFHPLAPLRYIDLRRNNLFSFEIDRIAPLCYLSALRLNNYIPSERLPKRYHNVTTYCSCTALETWLTNIDVDHDPLNCTLPEAGVVAVCDEKSIQEASQLRQKCLAKITPQVVTSIETNWLLILIIILIFMFLALPIIVNMTMDFLKKRADLARRTQSEEYEEEQNESEEEEEVVAEEEDEPEAYEERAHEIKQITDDVLRD